MLSIHIQVNTYVCRHKGIRTNSLHTKHPLYYNKNVIKNIFHLYLKNDLNSFVYAYVTFTHRLTH